jgi:rubrerythrin
VPKGFLGVFIMSLKTHQEKIIEQLIDQEKLLSELYAVFSKQFPQYQEFWEKMSKEELRHSKLIEKLFEAAKKGKVFFDEGKIKTYTLNAFLARFGSIMEKAERGEFDLISAFACAVDYETSLIEKNVFTRFDSLSDKAKGVLKILQSETVNHVNRIRSEQERLR